MTCWETFKSIFVKTVPDPITTLPKTEITDTTKVIVASSITAIILGGIHWITKK